jgi:hypothetical protein
MIVDYILYTSIKATGKAVHHDKDRYPVAAYTCMMMLHRENPAIVLPTKMVSVHMNLVIIFCLCGKK